MGFYEVLIYDRAFSLATQQALTRNQIAMRLNTKSRLKKLPIVSYSVRRVNSTLYSGPLIKIKKSSTNELADLYCDEYGHEVAIYVTARATNYTS